MGDGELPIIILIKFMNPNAIAVPQWPKIGSLKVCDLQDLKHVNSHEDSVALGHSAYKCIISAVTLRSTGFLYSLLQYY